MPYGISEWEHLARCRDLAAGMSKAEAARKYGVTGQAIDYFAKKHARQIDEIRAATARSEEPDADPPRL